MKKRWSIIFANSVTAKEKAQLTNELAERLKAVPDSYNNNAELRFSEGALPFTLTDVVNVIPASKIRAVTLDTRHHGPQLSLQSGVKICWAKGAIIEYEFDGNDNEELVREFDSTVKMSENCG